MNDFDDVLERLVSDPSFQAALARDPEAALAGYQLADEERELLRAQVVTGGGGDRLVEARTTKSGMAGLLGPVVAALGVASGGPSSGGSQSLGAAGGGTESFGQGPKASESFGSAGDTGGDEGFGTAAGGSDSMGSAPVGVKGGADSMGEAPSLVEAADYRTSVDVDGDGFWDRNRAYERADGGVDIHVDVDRDGVADFVGHDYNRDGLVDDAEFDDDLDGTMDRRMHDDTGDGWMDRETPIPRGTQQSFGQAPAS